MEFEGKHADITEKIIGAYYTVYNTLGYGFAEKVYENALVFELRRSGCRVETQKPLEVYYAGQQVGEYFADMVVDDVVIVELKAVKTLLKEHEAQLLHYLKATTIEVVLLFNFGPEPQFRRRVYDNDKKGALSWIKA
jgi:GxxExxY protein